MEQILRIAKRLGFIIEDDPLSQRVPYDIKRIKSLAVPEDKKLTKLLQKMSNEYYISFFDYFHRQISDPGAYIDALPAKTGYVYKAGNHGWSSDWKPISIEDLCQYILKNWKFGNGSFEKNYFNYITISENYYFDPNKRL